MLKSSFPAGVVGNKKEYYLSDEEFVQVLGMQKADWDALKQWKKDRKKKEVGLFWATSSWAANWDFKKR